MKDDKEPFMSDDTKAVVIGGGVGILLGSLFALPIILSMPTWEFDIGHRVSHEDGRNGRITRRVSARGAVPQYTFQTTDKDGKVVEITVFEDELTLKEK